MKICLDAGHGGADNGASTPTINEDSWALEFINRVGHYIRLAGGETVLTRDSDEPVGINERARIAVHAGCNLFVSIHCNAATASANGAEVFYAPVGGYQANSKVIADMILTQLVQAGLRSRGLKKDSQSQHPRLGVLRGTCEHMPAVLVEIGFITNAGDSAKMKDTVWRDRLAQQVASVILK